MNDIHRFIGHKMNLDVDSRDLQPNETRECYNIRSGNTATNGKNCIENFKSNLDITTLDVNAGFSLPSGVNIIVGKVNDIENNALVVFLRNSNGNHCIYRIWSDSRIEKLAANCNLFGFGNINHANVIGNLLYWTDGLEKSLLLGSFNPPRKINMVRASAMTNQYGTNKLPTWNAGTNYNIGVTIPQVEYQGNLYAAIQNSIGQTPSNTSLYWRLLRAKYVTNEIVGYTDGNCYQAIQDSTTQLPTDTTHWNLIEYKYYDSLTLQNIMRGKIPPSQPTWTVTSDPAITINRLRNKIFQFRLRYIYDDNEKSTWSCMSTPVLLNLENQDGYYTDPSINNTINLLLQTGTKEVVRIQIACRINNGDWVLIDDLHKYTPEFAVLITSNSSYTYTFINDVSTLPLDQTETNNLFSYTPQLSNCQELIQGNRIIDADITEGYDYPDVNCTLGVSYVNKPQPTETVLPVNYTGGAYIYTMPLFSAFTEVSYLSFAVPVGYSRRIVIDYFPKSETNIDQVLDNLVILFAQKGITAVKVGTTLSVTSVNYLNGSLSLFTVPDRTGGLKYSSTQNYGIVFYDELKRSCSVFKLPSLKINSLNAQMNGEVASSVPSPVIGFTLTGTPPQWAYSYQFCHTDNRYEFLYVTVPSSYITTNSAKGIISLNVDKAILDYLNSKPNSTVQPWTYVAGDRIRLLGYANFDSIQYIAEYDFEILDVVSGVYTIPYEYLQFYSDWVIEIYRDVPVNKDATVYFECGKEYLINNPRTSIRSYSVLTDTLDSYDTFQRTRSISGSYVYEVNEGASTFQIIDVSIPGNPTIVSTTNLQGNPSFITVDGSYAYITTFGTNAYLQIFDVSNPLAPTSVSSTTLGAHTNALSVRVFENYVYIVDGDDAVLESFDITNPSSPVANTAISVTAGPIDIAFKGTHAYVSGFTNHEINIIDISNPKAPAKLLGGLSSLDGLNNPRRLFVYGNYLFVANSASRNILIFDITNETSPRHVGTSPNLDPNTYSVFVQNGYAYTCSYDNSTLQILDISNITSPVILSTTPSGLNMYDVYVIGKYAYTADYGNNHIAVFDISNPSIPNVISTVSTNNQPRSLYATGNAVYNSVESKNYSDLYSSSQGDLQRVAVYDLEMKRTRMRCLKRWSGVYIANTFLNNLNFNDYSNYDESNERYGAITKIFEYGDVLTVRQEEKNTSYYLSKSVLQQAAQSGQEIVATSTDVLGSLHQSAEKYGCKNPESHVSNGSISYYADIQNGCIVRDGTSESIPISDNGIKNYIKALFDKIKNSNPKICGGFDQSKDELWYTIYAIGQNDTTKVTLLYNETEKSWKSFIDFIDISGNTPEMYGSIGLNLYAFNEGIGWLNEAGNDYNKFFGVSVQPSVNIIANAKTKSTFNSVKLVSNQKWKSDLVLIFDNDTYSLGMTSKLPAFTLKEGYQYAPFLRDMTTTSSTPTMSDLFNGRALRGHTAEIELETTEPGLTQLYEVDIITTPSL